MEISFTPEELGAHQAELLLDWGMVSVDLSGWALADWDEDGHTNELLGGDDCDDARADVHPGALERFCDDLDSDCDGAPEVAALVQGSQTHVVFSTVQEAVEASSGLETVWRCQGTHPAHIQVRDRSLALRSWPPGEVDPTPPNAVLTGEGSHRIIDMEGGSLSLRSIDLVDGHAEGNGGCVRAVDLDYIELPDRMEGCRATGVGGALFLDGGEVAMPASDLELRANEAGTGGAAIHLERGSLIAYYSEVLEDTAVNGGAIYVGTEATLSTSGSWGEGQTDNADYDVICASGATYDIEGTGGVSCDGDGCDVN